MPAARKTAPKTTAGAKPRSSVSEAARRREAAKRRERERARSDGPDPAIGALRDQIADLRGLVEARAWSPSIVRLGPSAREPDAVEVGAMVNDDREEGVPAALRHLEQLLEGLHKALMVLQERLGPVLGPMPLVADAPDLDPRGGSMLAVMIAGMTGTLYQAIERVEAITRGLEL